MSVGSRILDATGTKYGAKVTKDHALLVSQAPYPEAGGKQTIIPFRQYFTTNGLAGGPNDLRVDGSVTPVDFFIPAANPGDLYITIISMAVSDSGAVPSKFGTLPALTNGVALLYTSESFDDIYIHTGIKTNFGMVRFGLGNPSIGGAGDAFRVSNVIGNADTYMTNIDLARFIPPYGVQISFETSQQLILRIRDDLTGLDAYDAIAFGFIRLAEVV